MSEEIKLDEKELKLLAEEEAREHGFGVEEIKQVLTICKIKSTKKCIKDEFQKLNTSKKLKEAVESFKEKRFKNLKQ